MKSLVSKVAVKLKHNPTFKHISINAYIKCLCKSVSITQYSISSFQKLYGACLKTRIKHNLTLQ